MTTPDSPSTFQRRETVDKPGIIGARWWQESVATQVPRRQAMGTLIALGGVLAGVAMIGTCAAVAIGSSSSSSPSDVSFQPRAALDMQKEYGWNFGATGETLVFDGTSTKPFDRSTLSSMADDLAPGDPRHAPYFVATLFQSPTALPRSTPSGETGAPPFAPLKDVLVPIMTAAMDDAFKQGQALASLLDKEARAKDLAVVVDMPGPEAVAFAAGASSVLDPVFLFDNWPHPRGVVPAHHTLAAAAYYQPLFATARASRPKGARPMFVLDRKRLASYADDATQFDNRHTAKLPNAANLIGLGIRSLLYVAPNAVERQETDDLVDDFLALGQSRMPIHVVPATAFSSGAVAPPGTDAGTKWAGPFFYGGQQTSHASFWQHWGTPASDRFGNEVQVYTATPRKTDYSAGTPTPTAGAARPRPTNFGMVPVAIALGTGVVLGAKLSRSGSWNRTSSSSSSSGS